MSMQLPKTTAESPEDKALQLEKAKDKRLAGLKKWQKEAYKYEHTCKRCKGTFKSRLERPKKCRLCGDPNWDKEYMRKPSITGHKTNPISHTAVAIEHEYYNGIKMMAIKNGEKISPYLAKKFEEIGIPKVSDEDLEIFVRKMKKEGKLPPR